MVNDLDRLAGALMRAFFSRPVDDQIINVCVADQHDLIKAILKEMKKDHEQCSADNARPTFEQIEANMPTYVSELARELASAALDDIEGEPYSEDRHYAVARWFDATIAATRTLAEPSPRRTFTLAPKVKVT